MNSKQIDVTCPHCSTRITVDVRTETVLRSAQPEELDEGGKPILNTGKWTSAQERVRERTTDTSDKLDAALSSERERLASVDERFRAARDKAAERKHTEDEEE